MQSIAQLAWGINVKIVYNIEQYIWREAGPDWRTGRSGQMGRWPLSTEGLDVIDTHEASKQHVQGGHIYIVVPVSRTKALIYRTMVPIYLYSGFDI